jgi:general secretion pathway protein J
VALLSFSVRAQALAGERLDEISQFRRFGAIVTSDLAQASPRISRDGNGAVRPAFVGGTGLGEPASVSLVRRGWDNLDGSQRSSLQKVEYRVSGNRLERIAYRHVDGGAALDPMLLLDGVGSLRLRYRDERGEWRDRWDPVRPVDLPRAVEMVMDVERIGPVRLLFLVGPPS